jgi:hypothetical protein
VSEVKLLPPLRIKARSNDQKFYKVVASHPQGNVTIVVRDSLLTPAQGEGYTVQKADAIDILE